MHKLTTTFLSLALTLGGLAARAAGDTKADQLLAQARAALGGEGNLAKVHGLTASGTYQRDVGDRQLSGEVTIDLLLPDKMLRTESMRPMGDATIEMVQGINGDEVLRSSRTIGGGPGMVFRVAPPGADGGAQALRNQRADMTRLTLALLLTAPAAMPLEFAYGGEAESDDGKADVIDATGPGSFASRLFIDQKTHRPLMLAYRGAAPRMVMRTQRVDGPRRGDGPPPGAGAPAGELPPPQIVDIQLFLDDYRSVDGVMLPHHLSRSIDGKPNEDITFKTIRVNPTFKADAFTAR